MSITKYASEKWVKDQVSWSNLEDKPFGDIVASIGDTLTWDGDVTGKYCVEVEPELKYCLVSRNIPTKEDFLNGCTLVANMSGTTQAIEVTPDMVSENITFMEDGYITAGSFTVIPYDNYTVNEEFLFEKSGVYFSRGDYGDESNYAQSLTIPGFEFGSTTIKKIDPKFLPEGIEQLDASSVAFDDTENQLGASDVQGAISKLNSNLGGEEFGYNDNGDFCHRQVGADTWLPFKKGEDIFWCACGSKNAASTDSVTINTTNYTKMRIIAIKFNVPSGYSGTYYTITADGTQIRNVSAGSAAINVKDEEIDVSRYSSIVITLRGNYTSAYYGVAIVGMS